MCNIIDLSKYILSNLCVTIKKGGNKKTYEKRFEKLIELLSSVDLTKHARKNNHNTFSRTRKMPLKDILLCCLSKKGLTTEMELRKYFKKMKFL